MPENEQKGKPAITDLTVWRMIGMATRAGKAQTGADSVGQAMRRDRARLVLLADDAAEDTVRKIERQCRITGVPLRRFGTRSEMGHWTGHDMRAVAAIIDEGFASRIVRLIDDRLDQTGLGRHHGQQDENSTLGG